MSTNEPSEERINAAARAMQREDPVPMQMFTFNEICDLARAALIADAPALVEAQARVLREAYEVAAARASHYAELANRHVENEQGAVYTAKCGVAASIASGIDSSITALQADLDKERGNGC